MASPISRRPGGLLDLLLTQQQGKNPTMLGDAVSPVIEMAKFYETDRLTVSQGTANFTAVGSVATLSVPAAETWLLRGLGSRWSWATASQDLKFHYQFVSLPTTTYDLPGSGLLAATGIGDTDSFSLVMSDPFFIPSGTQIRCICDSIALDGEANILQRVEALYVRLES